MKFLIDQDAKTLALQSSKYANLIAGQLLTPLTRYANAGCSFAIDNGAFSGFNKKKFLNLLKINERHKEKCLFVVVPDIVGSSRRTLEIWRHRHEFAQHWPLALVAQDGIEDMEIPWSEIDCLFIGGNDPWKDSLVVLDLVKTAKVLGKHVHVGRVNTHRRFRWFASAGADTCDGSGIARYDHMLAQLDKGLHEDGQPLLWEESNGPA